MQADTPIDLERLGNNLAATMRAMSRQASVYVVFESSMAETSGNPVRLPIPKASDADAIRRLRGICDGAALQLRFHDKAIHDLYQPDGPNRRAMFHSIEKLRCNLIGSRYLRGTQKNLELLMSERFQTRAGAIGSGSSSAHPGEILELLVYEALSANRLPSYANIILKPWRSRLTNTVLRILDELTQNQHHQVYFAKILKRLIDLFIIKDDDLPWEYDPRKINENSPDEQSLHEGEDEFENKLKHYQYKEIHMTAATLENYISRGGQNNSDRSTFTQPFGFTSHKPTIRQTLSTQENNTTDKTYRIFTKDYDRIVSARDLVNVDELIQLRSRLDLQMPKIYRMTSRLANRLQRKLYARKLRDWNYEQEEGILNSDKLARVIMDPCHPLSYKQETESLHRDTLVALLIDNSGSMAGRKITVAAVCSDILASTLERCGIKTEILGFTTNSWKGGRPRQRWVEQGKQPLPGRLNELLHIIYKSAGSSWRKARPNLGLMLRTSILKENIDGEALLWAHSRLIRRKEDRRILIVISDGSPIDDATLTANGQNYLDIHLSGVIKFIENYSPIEILAVGIGHDVSGFYRRAVTIDDADELGAAIINQLSALFSL